MAKAAKGSLQIVLQCPDLDQALVYFCELFDARLLRIFPADDPQIAELAAGGLALCLQRSDEPDRSLLQLISPRSELAGQTVTAPNGTRIQWLPAIEPAVMPAPHFLQRGISYAAAPVSENDRWQVGRAGMRYRDLLPDRLGGFVIASHIHIPEAGPVADYVHHHAVYFQLIYCWKGWVRVVYQGQGEPFVLQAGDCVLQPPGIRHQVLESSGDLEAIEVGCPAQHATCADPEMQLPGPLLPQDHRFGSQRFLRFQSADQAWRDTDQPGLRRRRFGLSAATDGIAAGGEMSLAAHGRAQRTMPEGRVLVMVMLAGTLRLEHSGQEYACRQGQALALAGGQMQTLIGNDQDSRWLELSIRIPQ